MGLVAVAPACVAAKDTIYRYEDGTAVESDAPAVAPGVTPADQTTAPVVNHPRRARAAMRAPTKARVMQAKSDVDSTASQIAADPDTALAGALGSNGRFNTLFHSIEPKAEARRD